MQQVQSNYNKHNHVQLKLTSNVCKYVYIVHL